MMKSPIPPLLSRRLNKDGTYNIAKCFMPNWETNK